MYFYNVGRRRHVDHYYDFVSTIVRIIINYTILFYFNEIIQQKLFYSSCLQIDTNEYICIFFASVVLTLLFDAPFQNIKKLMRKTNTSKGNERNNKIYNGKETKSATPTMETTKYCDATPNYRQIIQRQHQD